MANIDVSDSEVAAFSICVNCEKAPVYYRQSQLCRRCRGIQLGMARRRYSWTDELKNELRAAYALKKSERTLALNRMERRLRWPRQIFHHQARVLGLDRNLRRPWTEKEDAVLLAAEGERSVSSVARELGRTIECVQSRAQRLRLRMRVCDGYSFLELQQILGCSRQKLRDWNARGLFGKVWQVGARFSDDSVLYFIRKHGDLIDFRFADELFLKGVLFGSAKRV